MARGQHPSQHPLIPCRHITATLSVSTVPHAGEGGGGTLGYFICQRADLRKKGSRLSLPSPVLPGDSEKSRQRAEGPRGRPPANPRTLRRTLRTGERSGVCARAGRVHASVSTYPRVVRITKGSGRWSGRGAGLSRARLPLGSPQPAQARPVHVSNARSKRACPRTPSRSLRHLYCHQRGGQPGWKAHPDGRPARKAASLECRRPALGR